MIDENLLHRYNKGSHSIIGTLREYDISLINRHRLIYDILDKMIKVEIHALSIKALTESENNIN